MKRLIFGCGYLGSRVALRWREEGDEVFAVTRTPSRAAEWKNNEIRPIVADVTEPGDLRSLPAVDTVLFAVGYDRTAGKPVDEVYAGGVRNVLDAVVSGRPAFVYISTTGVYGDAEGAWVDEQTPPDPQRPSAHASLAAEGLLRESLLGSRSVALRMGGLYGPGRVPFLDRLQRQEPIPAPQKGWLNLIHVEDAAAAVLAVTRRLQRTTHELPSAMNIVDGHPVQRADYYSEVARVLGAPAPKFISPQDSSARAVRAATDRRISNQLMGRLLRLPLKYPSYREGLRGILSAAGATGVREGQ